jgi:predicted DNA-binding transcriptional regulator AlpA
MTPDPLLSERQTSAALNLSTATLRRWRKARRRGEMGDSAGPAFVDLNGSIRYRRRDVEGWLGRRTVGAVAAERTLEPSVAPAAILSAPRGGPGNVT